MEKFKSWLKSWIFWLIVSVVLLALFIFLVSDWRLEDNRLFLIMLLLEAAVVMLLWTLASKNGMKILLSILICSVALLLLFSLAGMLGMYPDFFEEIFVPLLFALVIPSGALVLLKLIWKK